MIAPPEPKDELQRQETLRSTKLLDSPPEERFDRVTRLARRLFGVPVALVSLVDAHRQWFKSKQGLAVDETSREISFCGHAILRDDAFVVEDAREDARFADNPLVSAGPKIRFYAGHPLAAPDGSKLGTLCLISDAPRHFSTDDRMALHTLATMIESELIAPDLATLDVPTGLANLRGFLEIGEYLVRLAKRQGQALQLVLIRVDGVPPEQHAVDVAPKLPVTSADIARALLASFTDSDLVARCGPNEYGVLLSSAKADPPLGTSGTEALTRRVTEAFREFGAIRYVLHPLTYDPSRHSSLEALLLDAESKLASMGT